MSGNGNRGIRVRVPVEEDEIVPVTDEQIAYAAHREWLACQSKFLEVRLNAVIDRIEPLIRRRVLGEVLAKVRHGGTEPLAIVRRMVQDIGE